MCNLKTEEHRQKFSCDFFRQNCDLTLITFVLPSTMPEKYNEMSEEYKELLHDYLNFEETGFKPFDKIIGGANHYTSRGNYWQEMVGTKDSFRGLAKRVAVKACSMLPNSTLAKYGYDSTLDKVTNDKAKTGRNLPRPRLAITRTTTKLWLLLTRT